MFSVVHRQGEEVHLDRQVVWQGSKRSPVSFSSVVESVIAANRTFRPKVLADPWQALHVAEELRRSGVSVETYTFTAQSKTRLAGTLYQLVNDGRLRLYEAEGLRDELKALRLVPTGAGGFAFDHARTGHDDRAVSLALACVRALQMPAGFAESVNLRDLARDQRNPTITGMGMTLTGKQYLDRDPGGSGELRPPSGWQRITTERRRRRGR